MYLGSILTLRVNYIVCREPSLQKTQNHGYRTSNCEPSSECVTVMMRYDGLASVEAA